MLQDMLKALERRYEAEDKLTSGSSQPTTCPLAAADSEFDVGSSSTSCADSGRGLSCEVHDEPIKTLSAPTRGTEPSMRSTEPPGRNFDSLARATEPFGRETEPLGRYMDSSGKHLEFLGRIREPVGRNMATFGRGAEQIERNVDHLGRGSETAGRRGNTVVTVDDSLLAHTAALDACLQTLQPPICSTVNFVGSTGMKQSFISQSFKWSKFIHVASQKCHFIFHNNSCVSSSTTR